MEANHSILSCIIFATSLLLVLYTLKSRMRGGSNKQGVRKFLKMEQWGGRSFGLSVKRSGQTQIAPIGITATKYFLESCYLNLIQSRGSNNSGEV